MLFELYLNKYTAFLSDTILCEALSSDWHDEWILVDVAKAQSRHPLPG